jgi:pyruvate dehydrogenase E2 component (dihydrolipoamide acetyltransferase)
MPISLKMPALSPTMEEGTLAKWLVKEGDSVSAGDLLAEIETDKATMEFEAIDDGVVAKILVAEGTENVKVGTEIAIIAGEGEDAAAAAAPAPKAEPAPAAAPAAPANDDRVKASPSAKKLAADSGVDLAAIAGTGPGGRIVREDVEAAIKGGGAKAAPAPSAPDVGGTRVKASPLAKRIAAAEGLDLSGITGTGPNGRIVKADVENAKVGAPAPAAVAAAPSVQAAPETALILDARIPHTVEKLSGMRKTIARRLTESKQTVPHIYLTVDIRLDRLLAMRAEMNAALEAKGVKLSVNDLLIKALGKALVAVPKSNVAFAGNELISYQRADISVAVSVPAGLITPIISDADGKSLSAISTEMKDLAVRAKDGKLKPEEFQGGTASLSNMGMFGIKQFEAVINPPQGMIMAIGAGDKRPWVMEDGALGVASIMSATGSFDHRAIDGADGAQLMKAFREFVEAPLGMLA